MTHNLRSFFQKNVILKSKSGKTYEGFVETFTPAIDTEEEIDEIGLAWNGLFIEFRDVDIESINEKR